MRIGKTFLFPGFIFFITLVSWVSSCAHNADIGNIPEVCFEKDIFPVFQNSCAISSCHDGTGESDLRLTSYVPISNAVEPGKPYSSEIFKAIIATAGENKMPPDQPLSLDNRTLIRLWIEQGAGLTTCPDTTGQGTGTSGSHDAITHEHDYVFVSYSPVMEAVTPGYLNN